MNQSMRRSPHTVDDYVYQLLLSYILKVTSKWWLFSGMEVTESTARIDRDVRARERIWRTRANCMEAATKNFTGVLELLKSLKVSILLTVSILFINSNFWSMQN